MSFMKVQKMMELAPVGTVSTRKSLCPKTRWVSATPGPGRAWARGPPLYRGVQAGSMSSFMGGKLK